MRQSPNRVGQNVPTAAPAIGHDGCGVFLETILETCSRTRCKPHDVRHTTATALLVLRGVPADPVMSSWAGPARRGGSISARDGSDPPEGRHPSCGLLWAPADGLRVRLRCPNAVLARIGRVGVWPGQ